MIPLLEKLYKEIEHGDEEHRKWLWDKLEDFSKRECDHRKCVDDMQYRTVTPEELSRGAAYFHDCTT